MTAPKRKNAGRQIGATKGKLALVGVLSLVLIGVIASNFSSFGEAAANAAAPAESTALATPAANFMATTSPTPASGVAASATASEFKLDPPWPALPIKTAANFDPLAMPEWALPPKPTEVIADDATPAAPALEPQTPEQMQADAQAAAAREDELVAKRKAELAAVRDAATAIILVSGGERIALIGERELHVGDHVGGLLISDITSDGIVLGDSD